MSLTQKQLAEMAGFFESIKLGRSAASPPGDNHFKIRQIISYLEVMDASVRKLSRSRPLVFLDSGAGNAYLSFLVYYRYRILDQRPVVVHCVDFNQRLMDNARRTAANLGFDAMQFQACDITKAELPPKIDLAYSLHACDSATDKALALALAHRATCILSVSCCQHAAAKAFRNRLLPAMNGYKGVKNRLIYLVADTMRAKLLEIEGYKVDLFDFTSSRNTDKNLMIRARKGPSRQPEQLAAEYRALKEGFGIQVELERLLQLCKKTRRLAS